MHILLLVLVILVVDCLHLSKNPFYKVTVVTRQPTKYAASFPDLIFVAIDQ